MAIEAGFYWVKERSDSRWEVGEFDGVAWNIGLPDRAELYEIGPRIYEPNSIN